MTNIFEEGPKCNSKFGGYGPGAFTSPGPLRLDFHLNFHLDPLNDRLDDISMTDGAPSPPGEGDEV